MLNPYCHLGRVFKIEVLKVGGSVLAAENCTGLYNRLLRRQHCSSLCSQSEGHENEAILRDTRFVRSMSAQCRVLLL